MLPVPLIHSTLVCFESHCEPTPSAWSWGCTSKQMKASFGPCPPREQSNAGYRQLNSNCSAIRKVLWLVKLGGGGSRDGRPSKSDWEQKRSQREPQEEVVRGVCKVQRSRGTRSTVPEEESSDLVLGVVAAKVGGEFFPGGVVVIRFLSEMCSLPFPSIQCVSFHFVTL